MFQLKLVETPRSKEQFQRRPVIRWKCTRWNGSVFIRVFIQKWKSPHIGQDHHGTYLKTVLVFATSLEGFDLHGHREEMRRKRKNPASLNGSTAYILPIELKSLFYQKLRPTSGADSKRRFLQTAQYLRHLLIIRIEKRQVFGTYKISTYSATQKKDFKTKNAQIAIGLFFQ
ncbi:unnamed protein product [Nesidiocoris tenuis]|uniref:Uncharacterized protein n=1 Tax=Nesidiocoris tenuis TaxID=355587 RepID=A0A6H5GKT6_9HEMI|nr:unnamed protein product [Nesidiocoris tenuis]